MKKLSILTLIGLFTLSSFTTKNENKKVVKMIQWQYECLNGRKGTFWCNGCGQEEAHIIASSICN